MKKHVLIEFLYENIGMTPTPCISLKKGRLVITTHQLVLSVRHGAKQITCATILDSQKFYKVIYIIRSVTNQKKKEI